MASKETQETKERKSFRQRPSFRHWMQALWFALTNGYVVGYVTGNIFTGSSKEFCVPGLNCYSCPGAFLGCPIGSLQATLGSRQYNFAFYMFGFLMLVGSIFGRFVCGWLCPFGLVQDLLHKIPLFKKVKNLPGHKYLVWLKYIVLVVMVIVLPAVVMNVAGMGQPWFCEWICPSGTLFAGWPLVALDSSLRQTIGFRFAWKSAVLILIALCAIKVYRPFCKYLCPLGAVYGLFNPIAFYRFKVDGETCIGCKKCQKACKMDIPVWLEPNSRECIRCGDCKKACPVQAISNVNLIKDVKEREAALSETAAEQ